MPGPAAAPCCRVLIVDDDPGIRALYDVAISLDPRFELAATAGSAAEAIDSARIAAASAPVHAVLLDVTLPDGDGIELLDELRQALPGARIALFTGWSDDDGTTARAREAGADAMFRKDLAPAQLLDALQEICTADGSLAAGF